MYRLQLVILNVMLSVTSTQYVYMHIQLMERQFLLTIIIFNIVLFAVLLCMVQINSSCFFYVLQRFHTETLKCFNKRRNNSVAFSPKGKAAEYIQKFPFKLSQSVEIKLQDLQHQSCNICQIIKFKGNSVRGSLF